MEYQIFKLYFKTPCHFGEKGLGIEKTSFILHSDTIFNALVNAWAFLYSKKQLEDFLKKEFLTPSFLITSGFPFYNNNFYFPRIQWRVPTSNSFAEKHRKLLKFLEFIEQQLFEQWINGENWIEKKLEERIKFPSFIEEIDIPKNQLSRLNSTSKQFYFLGVIKFKKGAGVWFAVQKLKEGAVDSWIKPALNFLKDQGIGGKRNWGLGKFDFEQDTLEIKLPEHSSKFVALSLIFPNESNLRSIKEAKFFRWHLITRGGHPVYSPFAQGSSLRKPILKMIGEGSVLPQIEGDVLKIPEDETILEKIGFPHPVYHYGRAFLIPVNPKENYDK